MELSLITVILVIFFVFYLSFGIYILLKMPGSLKNRMFFSLCLHLSLWSFGYAFMSCAPTRANANFWREIASLGWCFLFALWLDYAILIYNNDNKKWMTDIRRLILYLPSFFFVYGNLRYHPEEVIDRYLYIWRDTYPLHTFELLFTIYYTTYILAGITLIYRWGRKSGLNREKKQANTIVTSALFNFGLGMIVKLVLPLITINLFPLNILMFAITIFGIYHAITKYQLMSISSLDANDFVLNNISDPVILLGNDMLIREINHATLEMTGYEEKEIIGQPLERIISELRLGHKKFDTLLQDGYLRACEVKLMNKDNVGIPCLFSVGMIKSKFRDPLGIACIFRDITDRKEVENLLLEKKQELEIIVEERTRKLKESNLQLQEEIAERRKAERNEKSSEVILRSLIMQSSEGIIIIDQDKKEFVECNTAAREILSMVDIKQADMLKRITDSVQYTEISEFIHSMLHQNPKQKKQTIKLKQENAISKTLELLATGAEFGDKHYIFLVLHDDTDRLILVERRQQIAKLEALGTLSGGIAHDFNNILSGIQGYTQLTLEELQEDTPQAENLSEVLKLGERAKNIIAQILTFSRSSLIKKEKVDLVLIAGEIIKMLKATLPVNIKIIYKKPKTHFYVNADAGEMYQLIMNLCVNAKLAFDHRGGNVLVHLSEVKIDKETAELFDLKEAGQYIQLEVQDNGCGMDEEVKRRIFEPFFTKRGSKEGTGLGLSVVHSIVSRMEGAIKVESEIGKGSTFTIVLPKYMGTELLQPISSVASISGKARVLLVDNEEPIVASVSKLLSRRGYTVTGVTDAQEALGLFSESPDSYDILLSDQVMPKLTGEELLTELRKIRPELPVIICSGFIQFQNNNEDKHTAYLLKPVAVNDYVNTIEKLCNSSV